MQQSDLFSSELEQAQSACLSSALFHEQAATSHASYNLPNGNPYAGQHPATWRAITQNLVDSHPLSANTLSLAVNQAWTTLWSLSLGGTDLRIMLAQLDLPASAIGSIFERLLALELKKISAEAWRGGKGLEKDLHYAADERFSIELKTSGQLGYKIFGNRSFNQQTGELSKKDKSGYYLTVNFYENRLTLVRFGWLDAADWQGQKSASGQAATLSTEAYQHKLVTIPGDYILDGPLQLVEGIGSRAAAELADMGIQSIRELIEAPGLPGAYRKQQFAAMRHSERGELRPWVPSNRPHA